jgi:hypothetical protein
VSKRSLQNSPLESSCVVIAFKENYSTSKTIKASPEKSQILSCDTLLLGARYASAAKAVFDSSAQRRPEFDTLQEKRKLSPSSQTLVFK